MAMQDGQSKATAKRNEKLQGDLRKLRRVDLLELLVDQAHENEENAIQITGLERSAEQMKELLASKNVEIEHLKDAIAEKDALIAQLQEKIDVYTDAMDILDLRELAEFQERATMEYLKLVAARKRNE